MICKKSATARYTRIMAPLKTARSNIVWFVISLLQRSTSSKVVHVNVGWGRSQTAQRVFHVKFNHITKIASENHLTFHRTRCLVNRWNNAQHSRSAKEQFQRVDSPLHLSSWSTRTGKTHVRSTTAHNKARILSIRAKHNYLHPWIFFTSLQTLDSLKVLNLSMFLQKWNINTSGQSRSRSGQTW